MASIAGFESALDSVLAKIPYGRLRVWKGVFFHPQKEFAAQAPKSSLVQGATDILLPAFIVGVLNALILLALPSLLASVLPPDAAAQAMAGVGDTSIVAALLTPVFAIAGWLISTALQFGFCRLFGGNGKFVQHAYLNALVMAGIYAVQIVYAFLLLVPCINLIAAIAILALALYSIYLQYLIVRHVHKLGQLKAAIAGIVLPLGILLAFYLLAWWSSLGTSAVL